MSFSNNSQSSIADWVREGLLPPPQSESTTLSPPRWRRPQPRSCLHWKATRIRTWSDWEDSCHLQGHTTLLWPIEWVPWVLLVSLHNPRDWTLPCSSLHQQGNVSTTMILSRNSRCSRSAAFTALCVANLRPKHVTFKPKSNREARLERDLRIMHLNFPVSAVQEDSLGRESGVIICTQPPCGFSTSFCAIPTAVTLQTTALICLSFEMRPSPHQRKTPTSPLKWRPWSHLSLHHGWEIFSPHLAP